MERFQEAREKAIRHLKAADHMLHVTYPLIQDTKLLLGVLDNIFLCLTNTMAAFLWHDYLFKRVPLFHENFESKFMMFRTRCVPHYKIDRGIVHMIQEIKDIIILHRQSPVEFRKKDRFIICSEDYAITAVTVNQIKDYLKKTKGLVFLMDEVVHQHERIFRGSEGRIEAR